MPTTEFGFKAGTARFKFLKLVNTKNGVYVIFPIPQMRMHLSFHYPNEEHNTFGAFLRIPGLDKSYPLELDHDLLTVDSMINKFESSNGMIENNIYPVKDDLDLVIPPQSLINSFSMNKRSKYMDISNFFGEWVITTVEALPELIGNSNELSIGLSSEKGNSVILYDHEVGAYRLSVDEFLHFFDFDIFGDSFQKSLEDALSEIESRYPDLIEKATPKEFISELMLMIKNMNTLNFIRDLR